MKYKKIISSLMLTTMTLNFVQPSLVVYGDEQNASSTVVGANNLREDLQQDSILTTVGETTDTSALSIPEEESSSENQEGNVEETIEQSSVEEMTDSSTEVNNSEEEKTEVSQNIVQSEVAEEDIVTEGDWSATWNEELERYQLVDYTGDTTDVKVPTTFQDKPVAISLVEMSDKLNLKGLTSFSATGTNKEIMVLDTSLEFLFGGKNASQASVVETVDMRGFDISNVKSLESVFAYCSKLRSADVSNWDTSNVTSFLRLFGGCVNLTSIDVSNWDTSNVTNMQSLFWNCQNLTSIDVSNWDTSNVTNMRYLFAKCNKLKKLDLSHFNVSNVTIMYMMFNECYELTDLNLSGWDLSNVENFPSMFNSCNKLMNLNLSDWKLPKSVVSIFQGLSNNTTLKKLDLSGWDLTETQNLNSLFANFTNLTDLNLSGWDLTYVKNVDSLFANCSNLTNLNVSNWKLPKSLSGLFKNYTGTTLPDLSTWDTSSVTDMQYMFSGCKNLTNIDVSNFDTSNVTNMSCMFGSCSNLTSVDVSNFDTSNVTSMLRMFYFCSNLTSVDVSNFDTSNVTTMQDMFHSCKKLTNLDVNNWNTSRVTTMNSMFAACSGLTNLDVSNWDISDVKDIAYLFHGCTGLTNLNLGNFDTSNVTSTGHLFENVQNCLIYGNKSSVTSFSNIQLSATNVWPDEIQKQVEELFRNEAHTNLNSGVTQTTIDTVKASVEMLPETEENRQQLLDLVAQAQTLLDKKAEIGNDEITQVNPYVVGTDEVVKGTYTADKAAYIGLEINGEAQAIVSLEGLTSGNFQYYIGRKIKTTDNVCVILYDANKNEITCQTVTVEKAGTDEITKVNSYAPGANGMVTGTLNHSSAALIGLEINGQSQGIVPCDTLKDGTFQYYPGNEGLNAEDKVEVVLYTAAYGEITRATVPIKQAKDYIKTVDTYIAGPNGMVSGTVSYDQAALIDLEVNGQSLGLMASDLLKDGTFQYYPGNDGLNAEDNVEVVLYTVGGVEITRKEVPIKKAADKISRVNSCVVGVDEMVTGRLHHDSAALIGVEVNGQSRGIVSCDTLKDGTFQYYIGKGIKISDQVEVVLYTAGYTEITRESVPLAKDGNDEITQVDPYVVGTDEVVTGTLTHDKAGLIGLEVNGEMQVIVPSDTLKDGTFQYYVGKELITNKDTDKVYVVLYSPVYGEITRALVPLK